MRSTRLFLTVGLLGATLLAGCGDGQPEVDDKLERIEELIWVGQLDVARRRVEQRLEMAPGDGRARLLRARIDALAGAYQQAIEGYEQAIASDAGMMAAHAGLVRALVAVGRLDAARNQLQQARASAPGDADLLLLEAEVAAADGNIERAKAFAEAVMATNPDKPQAYVSLAGLHAARGEALAAFAVLEDGLQRLPDQLALWHATAELAHRANDPERLVDALAQLHRLVPDAARPVEQLALAHHRQGDRDTAQRLLRGHLKRFPGEASTLELLARLRLDAQADRASQAETLADLVEEFGQQPVLDLVGVRLAIADGDWQRADALLRQLLDTATDQEVEKAVRKTLAGLALSSGDRDTAVVQIARVLAIAPRDADALVARAALAIDAGDHGGAIDDLEIVLARQPASPRATRLLVQALLASGDDAQAAAYLERLIAQGPRHQDAYVVLADLHVRLGRDDDARQVLELLLKVFPGDVYGLRVLVDQALKSADLVAALEYAESLKAAHPARPDGDYAAGLVYEAGAAYESAANAYLAALDKQADAIEPLTALVRARITQGKVDQAIGELERRLDRNPEHFVALNLLGELLRRKGLADRALLMFRKAVSINPEWAIPYANAADVLVDQGKHDAALALLRNGYGPTGGAPLLRQRMSTIESRLQQEPKQLTERRAVDG